MQKIRCQTANTGYDLWQKKWKMEKKRDLGVSEKF